MGNEYKVLLLSAITSVVFSCGGRDVDSSNLPEPVPQQGELQVKIQSGNISSLARLNTDSEDGIKNLHFFVFRQGSNKSNSWYKEDYQKKEFPLVSDDKSKVLHNEQSTKVADYFTSQPTTGVKRLAIVANCNSIIGETPTDKTRGNEIVDIIDLHTSKVKLSTQSVGYFSMVGEQEFHVNKGLNETTVNLTRLVAKVVLSNVEISKEYEGKIMLDRAFMMNVNGESFLQGVEENRDVEFNNPVAHGYNEQANGIYIADLTKNIEGFPLTFYVFENKGSTAKTMLVIKANYKKENNEIVPVYYSIVVKTEKTAKVLRNNVYTLSAIIKRPGSLNPEEPSDSGDLEVSISVDPWETNKEQDESFD